MEASFRRTANAPLLLAAWRELDATGWFHSHSIVSPLLNTLFLLKKIHGLSLFPAHTPSEISAIDFIREKSASAKNIISPPIAIYRHFGSDRARYAMSEKRAKSGRKIPSETQNPNNINKFFKGLPRPKTRADLDGPNNNHDDANSRWPRRHSAIAGRMKATSERKHAGLPHVPPPLSIMPSCPVSCPRAPKAHWQVVSRFPAMAAVF